MLGHWMQGPVSLNIIGLPEACKKGVRLHYFFFCFPIPHQ